MGGADSSRTEDNMQTTIERHGIAMKLKHSRTMLRWAQAEKRAAVANRDWGQSSWLDGYIVGRKNEIAAFRSLSKFYVTKVR